MSKSAPKTDAELKDEILALLDENRVMSLATVRPDGWPQVTMVNYVHDDLILYFVIARTSQKFANIERDPRVSIAVGHETRHRIRGLSMAARVSPVADSDEVERLNALILARYAGRVVFAPREASSVLVRAAPEVVSVIDLTKGPGRPQLVRVLGEIAVQRAEDSQWA
jgi:nitroimidazol reductase NimA-like FMN-containing flavoprotein (pyridoxamine 5'-phosphate oxidase superfamily)